MRVVVAPDSFKGSLDAAAVASAIGSGWRAARPTDELVLLPQADGGEGTLDAIASAVPGATWRDAGAVTGPDGRAVAGRWLALPDGTAVVELASSSGLPLMASPDPLGATTRGLGEVITTALAAGATALVVGLGGSASTDGGAGALRALGLSLRDAAGDPLPEGGGSLSRLASVSRAALLPPPRGGVRLLSDVGASLLGPNGAAAVFGPQKGATPSDVAELERGLARFAELLGAESGGQTGRAAAEVPGAGAAGGTGYGFLAVWGAEIEAGSAAIAALTGLPAAAASADVILTGEGRFDATSVTGKVVGHVLSLPRAERAPRRGVIAGSFAVTAPDPIWTASLVDLAGSLDAALADPARWLYAAGIAAARELGSPRGQTPVATLTSRWGGRRRA
jgi:glycerate kinase